MKGADFIVNNCTLYEGNTFITHQAIITLVVAVIALLSSGGG